MLDDTPMPEPTPATVAYLRGRDEEAATIDALPPPLARFAERWRRAIQLHARGVGRFESDVVAEFCQGLLEAAEACAPRPERSAGYISEGSGA